MSSTSSDSRRGPRSFSCVAASANAGQELRRVGAAPRSDSEDSVQEKKSSKKDKKHKVRRAGLLSTRNAAPLA